jgi:hypothetical protein
MQPSEIGYGENRSLREMEQLKFNAVVPSSPPSKKSNASSVAARLKVLMSAYRTDQFANPESFATQAAMVLERYSEEVVEFVTSPVTGLQRRLKWPPTIAELSEACDEAIDSLRRIAERPLARRPLEPRALPRKQWPEGHLANCFVSIEAPQYPAMKAIIESGEVPICSVGATMRECTRVEGLGVWVPFAWLR